MSDCGYATIQNKADHLIQLVLPKASKSPRPTNPQPRRRAIMIILTERHGS